ncbi:MAG: response regulator [Deltaproteobacteria bacterium]|nr:response regulator [Deltaproteobacteria bacterium]
MITEDAKNILVTDDSMFFRRKLGDILTEAGHRVEYARNGTQAVEILGARSGEYDLMTLDLDMPDMSGFQVLAWMSEHGIAGRPPVIVISSIFQTGDVRGRLTRLGAACFLTKDFSPQELILRSNQILFSEKAAAGVSQRERVPVSIPADYAANDGAHDGFILNISAKGVYLTTEAPLVKGTTIRMRFALPGTDETLAVDGVVRWTTAEKRRTTRFCGGGVMFTAIAAKDMNRIEAFVKKELIRLRLVE